MIQGKERYGMIDENSWDMILGRAGNLPGPLAPEIIELANKQGKEFYTGVPQDAYPDELDKFRKEMDENGWDYGEDDEELFEFAMHERQYRDFKSGLAKKRFEEELEKLRADSGASPVNKRASKPKPEASSKDIKAPVMGTVFFNMNYFLEEEDIKKGKVLEKGQRICYILSNHGFQEVVAENSGEIVEVYFKHGDQILKDDVLVRIK